jgi:hypothetical protein
MKERRSKVRQQYWSNATSDSDLPEGLERLYAMNQKLEMQPHQKWKRQWQWEWGELIVVCRQDFVGSANLPDGTDADPPTGVGDRHACRWFCGHRCLLSLLCLHCFPSHIPSWSHHNLTTCILAQPYNPLLASLSSHRPTLATFRIDAILLKTRQLPR